jgi:multiple sugar transport system substrate-binding protein
MTGKKKLIPVIVLLFSVSSAVLAVFHARAPRTVTVNFGNFAGSAWHVPNPQTLILYDDIIQLFQQKNPSIKIIYKSGILRNDYSEWLAGKVLTENEPDIFLILPEDFHLFADIGLLEPLNTFFVQSERLSHCNFFNSMMQAGNIDGTQYAMPFESDPSLMFVNVTLLEKNGLQIPAADWTWQECYELCQKITKDTDGDSITDQFGMSGFDWLTALYTNRTPIFDTAGTKALLDSDDAYDTFKFLGRLNQLTAGADIPDFDSGKVAFSVSRYSWYRAYGFYPYSILKPHRFMWQTIPLPRGPKGKNAADLKTVLMGISSRSRHKEAAERFLEFILSDQTVQELIIEKSNGLPPSRDLIENGYLQKLLLTDTTLHGNEIADKTVYTAIENAITIPGFRKYESAVLFINSRIQNIPLTGEILGNFLRQLTISTTQFLSQ